MEPIRQRVAFNKSKDSVLNNYRESSPDWTLAGISHPIFSSNYSNTQEFFPKVTGKYLAFLKIYILRR